MFRATFPEFLSPDITSGVEFGEWHFDLPSPGLLNGDPQIDSADSAPQTFLLHKPEPWPEPVDGAELLDHIGDELNRRVVLPSGGANAVTLWVMHTYALDAAYVTPRLAITSATKRCGKTTLLGMLRQLVFLALPAANISPAAVFRSIEEWHPTLLIDEADTFLKENEQLIGVLNSGHSRATAYVIRCEGRTFEPFLFSTWAPVAIGLIGDLPPTLNDRAIVLHMRRLKHGAQIKRWSPQAEKALYTVARRIVRWVDDHRSELEQADPEIPKDLDDRAADNWRPLLAIADLAGGNWPQRARDAALILSAHRARDDNDERTMLLSDLRDIFKKIDRDRAFSRELCLFLGGLEHRPWPEWRNSKRITPPQLARLLSAFSITPQTIRIGDDTAKGYLAASFRDAFASYLSQEEG